MFGLKRHRPALVVFAVTVGAFSGYSGEGTLLVVEDESRDVLLTFWKFDGELDGLQLAYHTLGGQLNAPRRNRTRMGSQVVLLLGL